jgi:diaminopimelate epimerase
MGRPVFVPSEIPFDVDDEASQYTLLVGDRSIDVSVLSMGNPHCILTVESVDAAAVNDLGPRIEHHARFPERTNVGFMELRDRQNIALRVHERGVGETQACGTGSCAAVVAGIELGVLDSDVRVQLPGGEVMVSWRGARDPVWLRGNAEVINDGTMNL